MTPKDWTKFILLCLIWGSNFLFIRIIVADVGPVMLVFFRVFLAFFTVLVYLFTTKTHLHLSWNKIGVSCFLGLFNVALPFFFTSRAEQWISSGLAGIINSTFPLFSLVFATIFLPQERITGFRAVGLLIGFSGAVILSSTGLTEAYPGNSLVGVLVMLLAPISYAIALVFARAMGRDMDVKEQSLGQLSFALAIISVAMFLGNTRFDMPSTPFIWVGIMWLGLICTGVGTLLFYSLLSSVGATRTSLIAYLAPVIAVILGIFVLDELFTWQLLIGGLFVISGIVWVNLPDIRKHLFTRPH